MRFYGGALVRFKGLVAAAQHNGKHGRVVGYQGERYKVKLLEEEKIVSVKEANLEEVVDADADDVKEGTLEEVHRCEECGVAGATLHCAQCQSCFYCSKDCQRKNWKMHKRVCSADPSLRPFVPTEMAIERLLAKQPKIKAPKDATCYICLEGDGGKSNQLLRGCACRGESAGFVHVECLTKLAVTKEEAAGDYDAVLDGWTKCVTCKLGLMKSLGLEMARRFWRRHRSSRDLGLRFHSTDKLATDLAMLSESDVFAGRTESDAADRLYDDASKLLSGEQTPQLLELNLSRALLLAKNGHYLKSLERLEAIAPQTKESTANPQLYAQTLIQLSNVLGLLHRLQESLDTAAELVTFCRAKFGPEHHQTEGALMQYASACAKVDRREESKAIFDQLVATRTRILGRDHPLTQLTINLMDLHFGTPHRQEELMSTFRG